MPYSLLIAYLIGSIPFALLLSRWSGAADPRRSGSGNVGAANVWRVNGPRLGVIVALLDVAKGAAAVAVARPLADAGAPLAGLAAIAGHCYPVWLRFRGGKGVATGCGAFAVLAPTATAVSVAVFLFGAWRSGYTSVGSVAAALSLPLMVVLTGRDRAVLMAGVGAAALIVWRHRANLVRLRAGTEHRLGPGGPSRARTAASQDPAPGPGGRSV
jgi:glycerol-3-phosphate acyltransferase PlsY